MARDSFVKGAVILSIGLGLTKVLGFYRLVLPRLMGSEGVGLFNMAYPVYSVVLVLSTAGIPVAISKLVAEKHARSDAAGAGRVFRIAFWLLAVLGLMFSISLFLSAPWIANNIPKDPRAYLSLAAISPAILFVSLMSAYRGLFQGLQIMTPPANSYVIEQVVRVVTMFYLLYRFLPLGIEYAAAGATFGAVTGGIAGLAYLAWEYYRRGLHARPPLTSTEPDPLWTVLRSILYLAVPISLAGLVFPVMQSVDLAVVPARLQITGIDVSQSTALFGELSGMAMPVIYVPTVFTTALAFSLVPAVSQASALGDLQLVRSRALTALRVTMAFAIPSTVGIYLLATQITRLLYDNPGVGPTLAVVSAGVIFMAVQQTTSGILQGLGRTSIPVKNLAVGAVIKLVITWLAVPVLGIRGAAYATILGFLTAAALNLVTTARLIGLRVSLVSIMLKPVAAATVMAFGVAAVLRLGSQIDLSQNLVTLAAIAAGAVVYAIVLLFVGGVSERDLASIPRYGNRITRVLKRFGFLRR